MIARKQEFSLIQKYGVPPSMAGDRNRHQVLIELDLVATANDFFNSKTRTAIVSMHDSFATKLLGKARMVGYVVAMGEKHRANSTHGFDPAYQLSGKARR